MKIDIYNADCFDIMSKMGDNTVDVILTDPPYLYLEHELDRNFNEELFFSECYRILKKDAFLLYFGRGASFYKWGYLCQQLGFKFVEEIIWDKVMSSSPMLSMMRIHETIALWKKGNITINRVYIDRIDYAIENKELDKVVKDLRDIQKILSKIEDGDSFEKWLVKKDGFFGGNTDGVTLNRRIERINRKAGIYNSFKKGKVLPSILRVSSDRTDRLHPTQKDVNMLKILVELTMKDGFTYFDPFMGVGSVGCAVKSFEFKFENELNFIGCEILERYFNSSKTLLNIN